MELKVYPRLSTCSKRAFVRQAKQYGNTYRYEPRHQLIKRLMTELNMTQSQVLEQIRKERQWILEHRQYFI